MPRMLDLFCGRFGWGRAFAERRWEVVGIDLVAPPEVPAGCTFIRADVLQLKVSKYGRFSIFEHGDRGEELWSFKPDFICASSPCEQFSVHGMKHFHPNPPYPELGIKLFNHTRELCEASGVPYVMENVRPAQAFVGTARHHCGPFYLWGCGVPPLMNQGISKGMNRGKSDLIKTMTSEQKRAYRNAHSGPGRNGYSSSKERVEETACAATIPPELASCVCDYAEALLRMKATAV